MAIAFSRRPVIERLIPADDTAEEFVTAFAEVLIAAGWEQIATVDPGYRFLVTSRQDLKAIFRVWADDTEDDQIHIQVSDESELGMSDEITLLTRPDRVFWVIAGHCQVFLSMPGVSSGDAQEGVYGHNFAWGIPYVSEGELSTAVIEGECGVSRNDDVTANIWWLSAQFTDVRFSTQTTLRGSLTCSSQGWQACRNGERWGGRFQAPMRILPLRHTMAVWSGPSQEITRWSNGDPLLLDPYIAWGQPTPARFRAQLYDALLASYHHEIDAPMITEEPTTEDSEETVTVSWVNYSYTPEPHTNGEPGTYNGTLFIMRGDVPERNNYAY